MKNTLAFLFSILTLTSCGGDKELADYVNPMVGTDGTGHTFPGAATPFGLVQLSPDTGTEGWNWCSGYHYSDNSIIGFSHSHLSGTGGADLGDILFMPAIGEVKFQAGSKENPDAGYRSRFDHKSEKAHAGYYSVYLDDPQVEVELTATPHVGIHKYLFQNTDKQHVIIDLKHGIQDRAHTGYIRKISDTQVEGFRRSNGWADEHTVYFVAEFDKPIDVIEILADDVATTDSAMAKNVVAAVKFKERNIEITAKVGVSYVDIDGARANLKAETEGRKFDELHAASRARWNEELGRVKVEGGTEQERRTFYTALYHSMLAPYAMSDVDGRYIGSDRKIHSDENDVNYGLYSLWDTFRALHPLITITDSARNEAFVRSLVRYYEQSGRLPVWDLNMRENNCMIGYHAIPVIVDAYMKGQRNFDADKALEAMVHSAMQEDYAGLKYYRQFGYLPSDKENNAVSKALEYAYDDWCIAQMAKEMGRDSLYKQFSRRAQFYKNHFDAADGFMKGRNSQGVLRTPFSPTDISILGQGDFTEGNSWHYSFFVPQDVNTHIRMVGGDQKYIAKLEEMFTSETVTADHSPDVSGLIGNYAQGNEPSHHAAYLYNFAGDPSKTQQRVAQIKQTLYSAEADGLCGNEDCGQMSAWYVFSAMGFYPVTPGSNIYVLGSPTFEKVNVGKFTLTANNASAKNIYIKSATWNGQPYTKSYVTHAMIAGGGNLLLEMGSVPTDFGKAPADRPVVEIVDYAQPSDSLLAGILFEPYITETRRVFNGEIVVEPLQIATEVEADVRYTTDGAEPNMYSKKIVPGQKITLYNDATLALRAIAPSGQMSSVGRYKFFKGHLEGVKITGTQPDKPYANDGLEALTDGLTGGENYKETAWVGFVGKDVKLNIKLPEAKFVTSVGFNTINEPGAWIILPFGAQVTYYLGDEKMGEKTLEIPAANAVPNGACYFTIPVYARVDRVELTLRGGNLPEWHNSGGNGGWMFVDEVTVF